MPQTPTIRFLVVNIDSLNLFDLSYKLSLFVFLHVLAHLLHIMCVVYYTANCITHTTTLIPKLLGHFKIYIKTEGNH